MKFPWSEAKDPLTLKPGNYEFEISKSEEKRSDSGGNLMWNISLKSLAFNTTLCYDRIMLEGSPKALEISRGKLSALGFKETDDVEAGSLLGRRGWVKVKETPAVLNSDGAEKYARKLEVERFLKEKPGQLMEPDLPF